MNLDYFENAIVVRLKDLGVRIRDIDTELGHAKSKDIGDRAVDLEDDEVLEGLGVAAQKEVSLLKRAMKRIKDQSYGICLSCNNPISEKRLKAVIYAPLCRTCANQTES